MYIYVYIYREREKEILVTKQTYLNLSIFFGQKRSFITTISMFLMFTLAIITYFSYAPIVAYQIKRIYEFESLHLFLYFLLFYLFNLLPLHLQQCYI